MTRRSTIGPIARLFGVLEGHPGRTFAAIGVIFAVVYTAAILTRPAGSRIVDGDAIQYYAYLRSLVFDRDLDFENDYQALYGGTPESNVWLRERTPIGRPQNMMSIGPALLWSPLYLLGVALAAAGAAIGLPVVADGFARPFPLMAALAGILYGAAGAYLCYRTAALRFSRRASFWGALLAWLGSPALYYTLVSPGYSHAVSLFASALFVFAWLRTIGRRNAGRYALLGALAGLAMLVRWPAVIYLALPMLELALAAGSPASRARQILIAGTIMAAAALLVFTPQLLAWRAIYGRFFVVPQGGHFMQWADPAIGAVLFSARRGLFVWTPALIVATAGLYLLWKRDRLVGAGAIVVLLLSVYVNAAPFDWWAGEAFGARRFVSDTVLFALGFAAAGAALSTRLTAATLRAAACAFIVYNGLLLFQYQLAMRGRLDVSPYPTTYRQVLIDRLIIPFRWLR